MQKKLKGLQKQNLEKICVVLNEILIPYNFEFVGFF